MALDFFEETVGLVADLEAAGLEYAVVGAVALAIHGVPRATADIDLLVPPAALDDIMAIASGRGFTVEASPMRLRSGLELRRVTKLTGEDAVSLDLLLLDSALQPIWESRRRLESDRGSLWVVSREGLIAMKAAAGRDQDLADIRRLEELDG